ncbi:MAG TPA: hypothetical protein PJ994_12840, partial [Tepidiformaceae bacterium]|nr:hypothetical protein [Tepidiformaceae bacterium]
RCAIDGFDLADEPPPRNFGRAAGCIDSDELPLPDADIVLHLHREDGMERRRTVDWLHAAARVVARDDGPKFKIQFRISMNNSGRGARGQRLT